MIYRILPLFLACLALTAAETEKIRNSRVVVTEDILAPSEFRSVRYDLPNITVYGEFGIIETSIAGGKPRTVSVKQGEVDFQPPGARTLKNIGNAPLRIVRVDFPGKGSYETWGSTGIPHYKLLFENRYARVYDIKVPANSTEPLHTHKDRVVVCFSGANMIHTTPDGHEEAATLTTGQIDWRLGATHVGHNIGKTDLWVVAIEPK